LRNDVFWRIVIYPPFPSFISRRRRCCSLFCARMFQFAARKSCENATAKFEATLNVIFRFSRRACAIVPLNIRILQSNYLAAISARDRSLPLISATLAVMINFARRWKRNSWNAECKLLTLVAGPVFEQSRNHCDYEREKERERSLLFPFFFLFPKYHTSRARILF